MLLISLSSERLYAIEEMSTEVQLRQNSGISNETYNLLVK